MKKRRSLPAAPPLDAEGKRKVRALTEMATHVYVRSPEAFNVFADEMLVWLLRRQCADDPAFLAELERRASLER